MFTYMVVSGFSPVRVCKCCIFVCVRACMFCVCVRARARSRFHVRVYVSYVYMYINILQFYGVAGKEDRNQTVLINWNIFDIIMCISYICILLYARHIIFQLSNNRFCCCSMYNIQLSLRHTLFQSVSSFLFLSLFFSPKTQLLSYAHARTHAHKDTHLFLSFSRTLIPHSFL